MQDEQLTGGNYYHIFNRGNNRMNLFSIPTDYEHFLKLYDKYISPVADTLAWVLMPNHIHLLVKIKENVVYKYSKATPIASKLVDAVGWEKWFEEHKWETTDLSAFAEPARLCHSTQTVIIGLAGGPDNVETEDLPTENGAPDNGEYYLNADRSVDAVGLKLKTPIPYRHFAHLFNAYSRYLQIRTGRTGNLFERPFKRKLIDNEEYLKTAVLYIHNNPVHHGFCSHPLEYPWTSYLTSISNKPTKLKRDEVIKLFSNKENFEQQHNQKIDIGKIEKWLEIAPSDLHDLNLSEQVDADRSINAVRSEERTTVDFDFDLSAYVASRWIGTGSDNVKMKEDGELKKERMINRIKTFELNNKY